VLVSNPDGGRYDLVQLDETGQVDVQVPHLGAVTVFQTAEAGGLQEGLVLRYAYSFTLVDEPTSVRVPLALANMAAATSQDSITFTADPATLPVGTERVRVQLPCIGTLETAGGPAQPIVTESRPCLDASEYYVAAFALDASGKALAATLLEHLPVSPGAKSHTLAFDPATPFTNLSSKLAPVDPQVDGVSLRVAAYAPGASYGAFPYVESEIGLSAPVAVPEVSVPVVTSFFEEFVLTASVSHPDVPGALSQRADHRTARVKSVPSSFDLDVAEIAPIASVSNESWTVLERPYVTYSLGEGGLGSCVNGRMGWTDWQEVVLWSWSAKAQQSGTFQVPDLPALLSEYAPTSDVKMMNWAGGVSHLQQATPCSDLAASDLSSRSARAPADP
jgi:hypothetical protein